MRRASHAVSACVLFICLLLTSQYTLAGDLFDKQTIDFAKQVNLQPIELLPVQVEGRVAILDTFARQQMAHITGRESFDGLPPTAAYLELYFNAGAYLDKPMLLVKERALRDALAGAMASADRPELLNTSRLRPGMLLGGEAMGTLVAQGRAARGASFNPASPAVMDALQEISQQPQFRVSMEKLTQRLYALLAPVKVIPVASGAWSEPDPQAAAGSLDQRVLELGELWRKRDSAAFNRKAAEFMAAQERAAGEAKQVLPSIGLRDAERFYNRAGNSTVVWTGFAIATVLLIMAVGATSSQETGLARWSRRAGMIVMAISTLLLLAGFVVRWMLSGRAWYLPPIMNQFEAIVGSAILAAVLGAAMGWRAGWRSCLALAASLYATAALLASHFWADLFGSSIKPLHGILNSPVMGIHVSVIIIGHALVGMTLFLSLAYLVAKLFERKPQQEDAAPDSSSPFAPSSLRDPYGRSSPFVHVSAIFDRCNLIVAQLGAWMVMMGTFLGAYWADFAWGRWWGWDAKEVWAMMTALLLVAALHLRLALPERHRGWVTAVVCILTAAAMLFNWIGVNYFLTGMHSYA